MISFECPHCSNHLEAKEELAGRDGWCRVCKMVITVPGDGVKPLEELSPEERSDRLDRLMHFAATKADGYKKLFSDSDTSIKSLESEILEIRESYKDLLNQGQAMWAKMEEELDSVKAKLEHFEVNSLFQASGEEDAIAKADKMDAIEDKYEDLSEQIKRSSEQVAELTASIASVAQSHAGDEDQPKEREAEMDSLSSDLAKLQSSFESECEERSTIQEDLAKGLGAIETLRSEMGQIKEDFVASTDDADGAGAAEDIASAQKLEGLEEGLAEFCEQLETVRETSATDLAKLRAEFELQNEERGEVDKSLATVLEQVETLRAEIGQTEEDLLARLNASDEAHSAGDAAYVEEFKSFNDELDKFREEFGTVRDALAGVEALRSEIEKFKEETLARFDADEPQPFDDTAYVEGLNGLRSELDEFREQFNCEHDGNLKAKDVVDALTGDLTKLSEEFGTLKTEIESLQLQSNRENAAFGTELSFDRDLSFPLVPESAGGDAAQEPDVMLDALLSFMRVRRENRSETQ